MEKYSVEIDDTKTKTAGEGGCPQCGIDLSEESAPAYCPTCGTEPFERRDDGSGQEEIKEG